MHRLGVACEHVGRHSPAPARSAAKLRIGTRRNSTGTIGYALGINTGAHRGGCESERADRRLQGDGDRATACLSQAAGAWA
jgi:hypothetical protein